jgi:calcineurin-like phosphoesterase family protein
MKIFIIADTHFGNLSLAEEYMKPPVDFEKKIIKNWKRVISEDDLVIHLRDEVVGKINDWKSPIPGQP